MSERWDETWHRLREWTNDAGQAERLAALLLHAEGYRDIDPSHPLGGPDGGKDALASRDGQRWIMAVYFPRGQQLFTEIKVKFAADATGIGRNEASGMAFVTNQELTLSQRKELQESVGAGVDLLHLERITTILDRPEMHAVRAQFLAIGTVEAAPAFPPRTTREILDLAVPTPGAPDHRSVYQGMLLLSIVAAAAQSNPRHSAAADPRPALDAAVRHAPEIASEWPERISLVARRLAEGWEPAKPHHWVAGYTSGDPDQLATHATASAAYLSREGVICVERTWPTTIRDERGATVFHAAREPEVAAELLVALGVSASLLSGIDGLNEIDVAVLIAASPSLLVSSERAVTGRRFGEPSHRIQPTPEVPGHHVDSGRFSIEELTAGYPPAEALLGPWLATFRQEDVFTRDSATASLTAAQASQLPLRGDASSDAGGSHERFRLFGVRVSAIAMATTVRSSSHCVSPAASQSQP